MFAANFVILFKSIHIMNVENFCTCFHAFYFIKMEYYILKYKTYNCVFKSMVTLRISYLNYHQISNKQDIISICEKATCIWLKSYNIIVIF